MDAYTTAATLVFIGESKIIHSITPLLASEKVSLLEQVASLLLDLSQSGTYLLQYLLAHLVMEHSRDSFLFSLSLL